MIESLQKFLSCFYCRKLRSVATNLIFYARKFTVSEFEFKKNYLTLSRPILVFYFIINSLWFIDMTFPWVTVEKMGELFVFK